MDSVLATSHAMIRQGSRSFAAAARLFDPATRDSAILLYAWCRHCDDQIDGQVHGHPGPTAAAGEGYPPHTPAVLPQESDARQRLERLEHLRVQTLRALAGAPVEDPVFLAFQRVAVHHHLTAGHALELLSGFAMDVEGHRYDAFSDTLLYCYRVAGVVGVMMAHVMGVRDATTLQRAADLGIAFQLTNIARDVLDDARAGRCYLPADWLAAEGIPAGQWSAPEHRPRLTRVVHRLLGEADRYYASARVGLRALPFRSAWAVATALGVYRGIGRLVRRRGTAAWDRRAVVGRPAKAGHVLAGALLATHAVLPRRQRAGSPVRARDLWPMPEG